jgi:hypothetical protein
MPEDRISEKIQGLVDKVIARWPEMSLYRQAEGRASGKQNEK